MPSEVYYSSFRSRDAILAARITHLQNARRLNSSAERLFNSLYKGLRVGAPDTIQTKVELLLDSAAVEVVNAEAVTYTEANGDTGARIYTEMGIPVWCSSFAVLAAGSTITATVGGGEDAWAHLDDNDWFEISKAENEGNNGLYQVNGNPTATILTFDGGTTTVSNTTDTSMRITKVGHTAP